jgi:ketosteroid isomerase-like protein
MEGIDVNAGQMDKAVVARVARLEDIENIKKLKHLYARHLDNGFDMDRVMELFSADAMFVSLNTATKYQGHSEIRQYISSWAEDMKWVLHLMINPIIEVASDGTSATGTWNLLTLSTMVGLMDPNSYDSVVLTGTYEDEFTKEPTGWKFRRIALLTHQLSNLDQGWAKQQFRARASELGAKR